MELSVSSRASIVSEGSLRMASRVSFRRADLMRFPDIPNIYDSDQAVFSFWT